MKQVGYMLWLKWSNNIPEETKNTINIDEIYYISDECDNIFNVEDKESYNKIISALDKREQEIVSLRVISNLSLGKYLKY